MRGIGLVPRPGNSVSDSSGDPIRKRAEWGLRTGAVLVPPIGYGILAWTHRWTSDDGFIFFRVVDQLMHGNGPVFNAGERVEAATSPLWTGMLAVFRLVLPGAVRLEYIALWASLVCSVFALVAASLGALRVVDAQVRRPNAFAAVPFGSLIVVAMAPFWDFATSGLEMGLVFAWLGGCFWALARHVSMSPERRKRYRWRLAVLLGLGPLIRPDLAVFSAAFLVAEIALQPDSRWRSRIAVFAAGVAVPALYQVFRMGYYATLIPNSALAKNPAGAQWGRGFHYLGELSSSYLLVLPLVLVAAGLSVTVVRLARVEARGMILVIVATLSAAALHAIYVVRVGGDFFHARLLLPALFAIVMPVAVISVTDVLAAVGLVVLAGWALVCGLSLRPSNGDQRAYYVKQTGHHHPVALSDYRNTDPVASALRVRRDIEAGRRILDIPPIGTFFLGPNGITIPDVGRRLAMRRDVTEHGALAWTGIGALSYAAGPDVFVVDRIGLGDPIGSRLDGFPAYLPIGHQRYMSIPWVEARLAAPTAKDPDPEREAFREAAHSALTCGDPARLLHDVDAPLSIGGFARNLRDSVGLTALRISQNPITAARDTCGPRR